MVYFSWVWPHEGGAGLTLVFWFRRDWRLFVFSKDWSPWYFRPYLSIISLKRDVVWHSGISYFVFEKILEFESQGKPNYFNDLSYRFCQNFTGNWFKTDWNSSPSYRRLYKEDYWWILSTSHDPTNLIVLVAGRIYRDRTKIQRTSHKKWHELHIT